ncbi:putative methyltransferase [Helianthus annuus]|uniref:Methyltransferase n=1 Tax=Helianthus annuus TaxID=4232 RepID=A0A251S2C4_HELAN|nr:putative methyltransferase [Helianthus annuus]KAJ0439571.1 putative methyltransferase [Helianthus annuus]
MEEQSSTPGEGSSSNTTTKKQRNYLGSGKPRRGRPRSIRPPRRLPAGQPEVQSPPCTDYDRAYFKYYSHVGVHEEMLKVYCYNYHVFFRLLLCIVDFLFIICYLLIVYCNLYLYDIYCKVYCTYIVPVASIHRMFWYSYGLIIRLIFFLQDQVRTETYRNAILQHQSHIKGKVVLDVGCGTGILSIFCAQAGAKRVYAVDASEIAMQDVQINGMVDVIVSEWMGYMLLYESMLGSVIFARDRWLKPGGLILPSHAVLYMAPVTHPDRYAESIDFWRNVYGVDMSPLLPLAKQCAFEEPCVETINGENVLTWPHEVKNVDCYTITIKELESVTTRFKLQSMMKAPLHGFAFWFDVEFNGPDKTNPSSGHPRKRARPDDALVLSTAPGDPYTHWQQTLVYFDDPVEVEKDQVIDGSATLTQCKENNRFMDIHLEYA